jgi:DNA-binding CsgD family transcriptional regulator
MRTERVTARLRGRRKEREALAALLADVADGRPRVLVLQGEAGIGKTTLLKNALLDTPQFQVHRTAGVESEMELAFAGLHQLCTPMLGHLDALPAPQREAVSVAFGLAPGGTPDRFRVGVAVLGLLAEAAGDGPVVCVVDDAHWLDAASAQVIGFVARRLADERVGLLFATRLDTETMELRGLPTLRVAGLTPAESRGLLESVTPGIRDERVKERILAETRGNPLALIELPRSLTQADYAEPSGPVSSQPLAGRIEDTFRRRLDVLPAGPRLLAIAAAAEPLGDPVLLWRAARILGLDPEAIVPVEQARLLTVDARVEFRHPLARSAVYRAASLEDRHRVHSALAKATDPSLDPDRRAWHRAQAAVGPDEQVADELELSASRAQRRGGMAAAAAFLARATALTPDGDVRAGRAVDAAAVALEAADVERAQQLLGAADLDRLDVVHRAKLERLRAAIMLVRPGTGDPVPTLLAAGGRLEPLDPSGARATYFEALRALISAGRFAGPDQRELVAQRTLSAPAPVSPTPTELLAEGIATRMLRGYSASVPPLKRALAALRRPQSDDLEQIQLMWLTPRIAIDVWDDEAWDVLSGEHVRVAREAGALGALPMGLAARGTLLMNQGRFAEAEAACEETANVDAATGSPFPPYGAVLVGAYRGADAEVLPVAEAIREDIASGPHGSALSTLEHALALLHNGRGDYARALRSIASDGFLDDIGLHALLLPEFVEAAVRTGEIDRARWAAGALQTRATAAGSAWGLGVAARCSAMLHDGAEAESRYRQAVDHLGATRMVVDLARARLLYGEWLRRDRRRRDAREQLELAHDAFTAAGAEGFAERAARELGASGARVRRRTVESADELTAQELRVALLARDGLSNPEIGAQLFISPRTVQYHLGKVFSKLGITSRTDLDGALPPSEENGSGTTTGEHAGVLADAADPV